MRKCDHLPRVSSYPILPFMRYLWYTMYQSHYIMCKPLYMRQNLYMRGFLYISWQSHWKNTLIFTFDGKIEYIILPMLTLLLDMWQNT